MDLSQFILALRARRRAFMVVLGATVIAALAIALIVPKRYIATATVLVDARDEQSLTASRMSPRERAGYISTQVDLVQSGRVATKVAHDLKLAQEPGMRDAWESETGGTGNIDEWIGAQLLEKLKADTSASNIITVMFTSPDAKRSQMIANGFAAAYMQTVLALRTEPSREAAEWFEDQLKGLRKDVERAQSRLTAYQRQNGIVADDLRLDVESTRIGEINTQLLTARNATYDAQTRYKEAQQAMDAGQSDTIPDVLANAYLNGLKGDLVRAQGRLEDQSAVLGPNHPAYQRTHTEVEGLTGRIAAETKKIVAGLASAAKTSQRREDELKNALAAQNERLLKMKDARVEMSVMTRDIDNSQKNYDAAVARYMQNKIDSAAKSTNVALLTPAAEPVKAAQPRIPLISALALIVGLLLAAAVVYLLETLDRRVRSRADLESRLAVPSFGRLSRWEPTGGRLLPVPLRTARALPHPW
jgi:chain length determinant protein EpsF